jgi:hypothetical protein
VADRLLVVSSQGGEAISDAVLETRRILHAAAVLRREPSPTGPAPAPQPRFGFDFRGARQGFERCPLLPAAQNVAQLLDDGAPGLTLAFVGLRAGTSAAISTPTFLAPGEAEQGYATVASPTLYPTQTVVAQVEAQSGESLAARLYVYHLDVRDGVERVEGPLVALQAGGNELRWKVPPLQGMPIVRVGLEVVASDAAHGAAGLDDPPAGHAETQAEGAVRLLHLNWSGAPEAFVQEETLATVNGLRQPGWLRAWVSSASNFAGDSRYTCVVSHPEAGGVATLGSLEWQDYVVSSRLSFSLHQSGGLVLRCRGHRRYLAAQFVGRHAVQIVRVHDGARAVIAEAPFPYEEERPYLLEFASHGRLLRVAVDGRTLLEAEESTDGGDSSTSGAAGFVIDSGTLLASGFAVRSLNR